MVQIITRKQIGRAKSGDTISVRQHEARALVAIGLADYVPAPKAKVEPKAEPKVVRKEGPVAPKPYLRRDMVTATPAPAASSPIITKSGDGQA